MFETEVKEKRNEDIKGTTLCLDDKIFCGI
jgi:hypothetical protein